MLNFCLTPSPSRSVHMADPILPLGIFNTVAAAYMPALDTDPSRDPLISPYFAHDKHLQLFPPTFIGTSLFASSSPFPIHLSTHPPIYPPTLY